MLISRTDSKLSETLPAGDAISSPAVMQRHEQLVWMFLLVGLLARCTRYFLRFPLWEDECFLCVNFIDRGFTELLQPLEYGQVAPTLFLWIELLFVKMLGYNELSLRLFGFLCSIASLFVFRHVARRLLSGMPQLIAIGIFCVSYPGIRYAAEAKQYASDGLVGLILLALAVEWWKSTNAITRQRLLLGMAVFVPFGIWLSLPAVFASGGVSAFIAFALLQQARAQGSSLSQIVRDAVRDRQWQLWGLFNLTVAASFLIVMRAAAKDTNVADMDQYWNYVFPPLMKPWQLPMWFLTIHAGDLLAYPIGGGRGASSLTFIAVACAIVVLWRCRQSTLLVLLLASPLLHLTASALHKYPYGGHVKFSQHMSGIICLLSGIGIAAMLSELVRFPIASRRMVGTCVIYLAAIGTASMTRDVMLPYKTESDMRARAFAEWFWFNAGFDGEVLCVKNDLHQNFCPEMYKKLSWVAMYQCNKKIYEPRRGNLPERLARVSNQHPLRCVVYRDPRFEFDQAAFDRWIDSMKLQYELIGSESFAFPRFAKGEGQYRTVDYLDEYKFVPKNDVRVSGVK